MDSITGRGSGARATKAAILVLIVLTSLPVSHSVASAGGHPMPLKGAASRPASMSLSTGLPDDPLAAQGGASPVYDEQLGTTFTQDFDSLAYNVTALALTDTNGYGPGYLLNGLTPSGYWYQVGVSYHWPDSTGGYFQSFGFNYQVYGPTGKPVFPLGGGAGETPFSGTVNSGDTVLLTLNFSSSNVVMQAQDLVTGANAQVSFSGEGATFFAGDPTATTNSNGFFTGLMTEWYHSDIYKGNEPEVVYSNQAVGLVSAWLWIDEFQSGSPPTVVFSNETKGPLSFTSDKQLLPFAAGGATEYVSAHQFITGMLSSSTSTVLTLSSATSDPASPTFSASFTSAGKPQTMSIGSGTSLIQADPGTSITLSVGSSSIGQLEKWVFNGTSGTSVTFSAGASTAFVFYHLVQETVSYQVAAREVGPPAPSAPTLSYEAPPQVASNKTSFVTTKQTLGTSPSSFMMVLGTNATVDPVAGASGERWAAVTGSWPVSAPNDIPNPVQLYHQYDVTVGYSIVGGGSPSQTPSFNSTAFGSQIVLPLQNNSTTGWFDAGASYSFTQLLTGQSTSERWQQIGANGQQGEPAGTIAPGEVVTGDYVHQYSTDLEVSNPGAGKVGGSSSGLGNNGPLAGNATSGQGWSDAGSKLSLTASANSGWQFETWRGSGAGAYNGNQSSIGIPVAGPLKETAIFYVQLALSADPGVTMAWSSSSGSGTVQAGTTKTLYLPPSSTVTLTASPSLFLFSFSSWQGAGAANPAKPAVAVVVASPTSVKGTSTFSVWALLVIGVVAVVLTVSIALWVRRRNRSSLESPPLTF